MEDGGDGIAADDGLAVQGGREGMDGAGTLGRDPMGLLRRRHFASRGRTVLGIDDELFGAATEALDRGDVQGYGALI